MSGETERRAMPWYQSEEMKIVNTCIPSGMETTRLCLSPQLVSTYIIIVYFYIRFFYKSIYSNAYLQKGFRCQMSEDQL